MAGKFSVTILGSNSSLPASGRMLSSQIVEVHSSLYMIDCGEGTQLQLSKFHVKRNKIRAIFISHLHGDHLYGLPGLLSSYSHFERKEPLTVFGPKGLAQYIETIFSVSEVYLGFEITIIETDTESHSMIYEDDQVSVYNFPLSHRVPTQGFCIVEKPRPNNIDPAKIESFDLTIDQIKLIKQEKAIEIDGKMHEAATFIIPPPIPRKYLYCSDTAPLDIPFEICQRPDLLYHEATYLSDMPDLAISRGHSTTHQAIAAAKTLQAVQLALGHFSSRYKHLDAYVADTATLWPDAIITKDGMEIVLPLNYASSLQESK